MTRERRSRTNRQRQAAGGQGRINLGAEVGRAQPTSSGAEERVARRSREQRRHVVRRVVWGLVGVALIWQLLSPIQRIEVAGGGTDQATSDAAIEAAFTKLSRRNLLINGETLAAELTRTLPDAVAVTVDHNLLLSRLRVRVVNQAPAVRWQSRGVQYRLSDHGFALALSDETDASLPVVFDEANVEVIQKEQVVPRDFVTFVRELEVASTARQRTITDRFVSGSTREMRITLANIPYSVRLSTLRSPDSQLDEFQRLEGYFAATGKSAREYVDLRTPGRAYWR